MIQLLKMKEKFYGFCLVSLVSAVLPLPQTRKLVHVVIGHKQGDNKRYLPLSRQLTQDAGIFWNVVCIPLLMSLFI